MTWLNTASALAQTASPPARPEGPAGFLQAFLGSPISMLILIFIIFYFLIIRPQQKRQREVQDMLRNLQKGDKIVTNGGMYGKILDLTDTTVTLQVDDKVKIKMSRSSIAGLTSEE